MIKLLLVAIEKEKAYIAICEGETNPQILEMKHKAMGKLQAYQACLDAARGDKSMLKIAGSGFIDGGQYKN